MHTQNPTQARHIGLSNPFTRSKLLNSYDKTSLSDCRIREKNNVNKITSLFIYGYIYITESILDKSTIKQHLLVDMLVSS